MRSIEISTDVFARIWALRESGEDTEDAILRRVLKASVAESEIGRGAAVGFSDKRFQVQFPPGFEIFRVFRGTERRAWAEAGCWRLEGREERYVSLNELSRAIGAGTENAWVNWWFADDHGQRQKLDVLRNRQSIARRSGSSYAEVKAVEPTEENRDMRDATWLTDVLDVMRKLGVAPLAVIYREVRALRAIEGRSRPASLAAIVRRTLEENSSDSDSFKGRDDLFRMPNGKGAGMWALR